MTDIESRIDTSRPHTARIWNYWTGGKDNYPVDREAGDRIRALHPGIGDYAKADRLFLGRAVRHLAEQVGIRQFLDIGTGLPSADNTHEVAQRVAPDAGGGVGGKNPRGLAHAPAQRGGTPRRGPPAQVLGM
ncbi:SAM-dependent methyltransferase [Streptomyces sp. NPDC059082]|uniref:SAM-dependent methyltransferase n=1 Tax=Streptomyces sp. NPDC059082 TaxID=3346720 RepID=UPI00367F5553